MREQIKLIFDSKNMEDCMSVTKRMNYLMEKHHWSIVDVNISENVQEYYLEQKGE